MEQLKIILLELMPVAIFAGGIILISLLRRLDKSKLDTTSKVALEQLVQEIVTQGVFYADKMASKKRKENIELGSQEKLYLAIDYIESMLESNNIASIARTELESRIDAALSKEGV